LSPWQFDSQTFHLADDHGEPLAGLASPCSLNGGIQGQQVRLASNTADQQNHVANSACAVGQRLNQAVGVPSVSYGALRDGS
jgi:hypothetical protein